MAHHGLTPASPEPAFDLLDPSTFPRGGITEIIPSHPSAGLTLIIASILEHEPAHSSIPELALIDGRSTFDPASFSSDACSKLLWIRCQTPEQSIKAADLILRDGNLPRVIIDLLGFPSPTLHKIPDSSWHRLNRMIQTNDLSLIALSRWPLIPCARLRLSVQSCFKLHHLTSSRSELIQLLRTSPILRHKIAR